jgi:hypothetical protein
MGNHHPVEIDPQAAQNSWRMWAGFTKLVKYSIIAVVVILGLMALFLL